MEAIAVFVLIGVAAYFFFKHMTQRNADRALATFDGQSAERSASGVRDWVQPFILYYVASEMQAVPQGTLPATVRDLVTGDVAGPTRQSLLVSLQNYLSLSCGRNRQTDDLTAVLEQAQIFLRAELQTLNSPLALKRFIRQMHREETQSEITAGELDAQFSEIVSRIRADDEFALSMRNMMLKANVEELFAGRHGVEIEAYNESILTRIASQMERA